MDILQAVTIQQLKTVQSTSLVAKLKPHLQSAFLDILHLFNTCEFKGAYNVEQVKTLLKNSSQCFVSAKEVSDQHLAEANALWEHSTHIHDVYDGIKAKRNLKEHQENESLEDEIIKKAIDNARNDLDLETDLYSATLDLFSFVPAASTSQGTLDNIGELNRYYDLQEILELSEGAIIGHQDRLDRLLIISKTIQEDKENSARESVALNEKTDELWVKRTWMGQMRSEIREISYCVNKLNAITNWGYNGGKELWGAIRQLAFHHY